METDLSHSAIESFSINQNDGSLAPLGKPTTVIGSGGMTMSQDGRFIYASVGQTPSTFGIAVLSVGNDGSLTPINGSPFTVVAGKFPGSFVLDPKGRFLFDLDGADSRILVSSIDSSTGSLSQFSGGFPTQGFGGMTMDRSGSLLLERVQQSFLIYSVNSASGALSPAGSISSANYVGATVFDPSNSFLVIGDINQLGVTVFAVGCTPSQGPVFSTVQGSPFPVPFKPGAITISR